MSSFTLTGIFAGVAVTILGLSLQTIGYALFKRYGQDDTKELAGVVGFRVSAIFGIAVGLIFAASAAYLIEAKRNLQEEVRLIGTLQFLAAEAPTLTNRGQVQQNLTDFAERSLNELNAPEGPNATGRATSHLLIDICRSMALTDNDVEDVRWSKTEFQRSCSKLIDLRGQKRVSARESLVTRPFWIFFGICFCFLAVLFGVFSPRPLNIAFACIFYFTTGITGAIIYAAGNPYADPGRVDATPFLLLLKKSSAEDSG